MEEIKVAVLAALQKEMLYFLMPERATPSLVELRVFYDSAMASIRVGREEILRALAGAGDTAEKEKADTETVSAGQKEP